MAQSFLAIHSLLLVKHQKLADKVLALLGNVLELNVIEVKVSILNFTEDFGRVLALEW